MKVTDLFNKREEFETVETFAKRLYQTSKRICPSLMIDNIQTQKIILLLAKYYQEDYLDIQTIIRGYSYEYYSKKYNIQLVQCLGKHYLTINAR